MLSLGVVSPWYGVPLFEQLLFFLTDYSADFAATFLTSALGNDQVENATYLWSQVKSCVSPDSFGLVRSQIDVGFYLPRAEFYRETARTYEGSLYSSLFSLGDPLPGLPVPLRSSSIPYDFDLPLNGGSSSFVYADLHNTTVAQYCPWSAYERDSLCAASAWPNVYIWSAIARLRD
jgi:hypothetical protein